jgi:NAD(P)-dependent dehydrogenase (short-subunit alcohol dehydrogenase family)
VADRAVEEYGRLDTWVHLAAVGLFATFEQTTPEEFARVIAVNLMGQVYGAMAALPHIKREGRGTLIHISSMGAKRSIPLQSAYCASKHGIDGFLEALRVELKHEGWPISVTQVMPATINTPFFDKARTKLDPARSRELGARPRRRRSGQGGDLDPDRLPPPAGRRFKEGGLRGPLHRRAQTRRRPGQPLRAHRRPQHERGILRRPGAPEKPLQLAGDAPGGEARGCGWHGARAVGCLASQIIVSARRRARAESYGGVSMG